MQTTVNDSQVIVNTAVVPSPTKTDVIRVLHVDDDISLLEISKTILMDMDNFEIDHALSVEEALKKIERGNYDVVVSDYEMPQRNGLDFLKELRQQRNEIPFILFTGKGREEIAIKALNLGAEGYINKYGNPETVYGELAHSIRTVFMRKKAEEKANQANDRYAQLFATIPNAVAVYESIEDGKDFVFIDFNPVAEKIEKVSKDQVLGKKVTEVFPGVKELGLFKVFQRVWKTGQPEYLTDSLYKDQKDPGSWRENWVYKLPSKEIVAIYRDITGIKKAQTELEIKYETLERIAGSIDSGLAIIGKDYRVVWANQILTNAGFKPNQKCYHAVNRKDVCPDCGVRKIFEEDKSLDTHEYETTNSKGEKQFIELRATPLKNRQGKVTGAIELAIPITERKKIELKLVESEEKSRTLSDESPNMIFINLKGKVVYVNKKCTEVLGYSSKEFTSPDFNFLNIVAPECHPVLRKAFAKHMKGEEVPPYDYTLISRKGDRIEVEISTKLISYEGETAILGVVTDVTERKKADDAVKASEAKLREVLDASPFPVALVDINDDKIFYWSQSATALFGYSAPTAKQWYEIAYPDLEYRKEVIEKWKPMLELAKQTGKWLNTGEYNITCKDGSVKVCNLYAAFLADMLIVTFEDINERKKTQQMLVRSERKLREYSIHLKDMVDLRTIQLKDANERLVKSERFAAIGELAGMVGHDLRNPLAGIKNATYFLKKKGSALSEEQTRAMLENIEKGIDHSDKIISDLLEYAGEIHLKTYAVSAQCILENIQRIIKIPENVKIIDEIPNNLNIRVDQNKIERVFINLIKNAIDAMPNGGTITIRSTQTKDKAEISFADTGTGIPEDVLPKLFNPLFTTKAQGMGFGLAICKRVVEAHGGTVTVETVRGKGTTFKVTLPIETKTGNSLKRI